MSDYFENSLKHFPASYMSQFMQNLHFTFREKGG